MSKPKNTVVLATLVVLSLVACHSKRAEPAPVASASAVPDRNADGKLLAQSLTTWARRWATVEALPDCAPLSLDPAGLEACTAAQTKLEALKAAVAAPAETPALIAGAKALALAAQEASEKLEAALLANMRQREEEAKKTKLPSGSNAPAVASSRATIHRRAWPQIPTEALDDQTGLLQQRQAASAYANVSRMAVRYLAGYLIYAPLPIRQLTLPVFVELAKHPNWPAVRSGLHEALALEADPSQKAELQKLIPPPRSLIRPAPSGSASASRQ